MSLRGSRGHLPVLAPVPRNAPFRARPLRTERAADAPAEYEAGVQNLASSVEARPSRSVAAVVTWVEMIDLSEASDESASVLSEAIFESTPDVSAAERGERSTGESA